MSNPIPKAQATRTENPDPSSFNMHTHDQYEIFCFLEGNAKYFVEGNTYPLKSGDIFIMKKAEAHSLLISGCVPYERIVVNFSADAIEESMRAKLISFLDNRPLGRNNRYSASVFHDTNWLYYLKKICSSEDVQKQSIYLTVLLSELYEHYGEIKTQENANKGIMDIVKFINNNLSENISLDSICERFFISKAHINRKFKKIIGSTVWEYITAKRLLLAKEQLQNGMAPTSVYMKCGYKDYCTFFRAYKAKFGVSPKTDARKHSASYRRG